MAQNDHDAHIAPENDLNHAGSVVDKAIEFMADKDIPDLAIASALLGGALGLLARTLPDPVVVQILQNAIASVQSGEIHRAQEEDRTPKA